MKNFFIASAILALAFSYSSCSDLYEKPSEDKNAKIYSLLANSKSKNVLKINLNSKARYITPGSYDLSQVTEWTLIYKDENDSGSQEKTLSNLSSTLSYTNGTLTASGIPIGTYKITIKGNYVPSSGGNKIYLEGSKNGVEISSSSGNNSTDILVGLAKSGKGSLSLNITNGNDYTSDMLITLTNVESLKSYSSFEKTIEVSSQNSEKNISVQELESGWYKLEFYINSNTEIKDAANEFFIEIADGITTTGSITLKNKFLKSACVWIEESENSTFNLNQISNYDDNSDFTEINSGTENIYCFDKDLNLLAVSDTDKTIKKYTMQISDGLYSTTFTNQTISQVTGTIIDICYDAATEYTYILAAFQATGTLYAIDSKSNFFPYNSSSSGFLLSSDSSVTPEQIAAYNGTIYVSGSDCAIYKASVSIGNNNTNVVTGDFSKLAELGSSSILSGYDSSKHKGNDSLSVTDLQVGDGIGNNAGTLYALVREYTSYIDFDISSDVFSRGALVAIDTSSGTTKTYGWTESYVKFNSEKSLYSPSSSNSSSGLFGPTHFVAIVPKKIVILDDGIVYSNNSDAPFNNNDSLVEFDIAGGTLKRGASVTATKPDASSFTIN